MLAPMQPVPWRMAADAAREVHAQVLRAVELDPALPYAYQALALTLIYMGQHEQALEAASSALRLGAVPAYRDRKRAALDALGIP